MAISDALPLGPPFSPVVPGCNHKPPFIPLGGPYCIHIPYLSKIEQARLS